VNRTDLLIAGVIHRPRTGRMVAGSLRGGANSHVHTQAEATLDRVLGERVAPAVVDHSACNPKRPSSLCSECRALFDEVDS
jgi:hypothetical protein